MFDAPPSRRPMRALALFGVSLLAIEATAAAAQGPQGGSVARGSARISQTDGQTTIRQTSQRAVIDWRGFDVDKGHSVVFDQPNRKAATLNRVNSVTSSMIAGTVRAPGTVIIQNSAGVVFTGSAKVDVGGLVATSQTVRADRFLRDGSLSIGGRSDGSVVNAGTITVGKAGLAALVGGHVENSGAILADTGTVALASGLRTTIDLGGDGLVRIAVKGNAAGGSKVTNGGSIAVGAGRVLISAGDAAAVVDAAINTDGVIRANDPDGAGGTVEIIGRGKGKVRVGGLIAARGATGGAITATGNTLTVASGAELDARGAVDGGGLRLGGDARGQGPLRRAQSLQVEAGSALLVDGAAGRGGSVVGWADGDASFDGTISATGATGGGSVETSAQGRLGIGPHATVALGSGGGWLLDPRDVVLASDGGAVPGSLPAGTTPYTVSTGAVIATLESGGDVTITTHQPDSAMAGDITVASDLTWSGSGDLRLQAERDISLAATIRSGGAGDVTAVAARDITNTGTLLSDASGAFTLDAGRDLHIENSLRAAGSGGLTLTARAGDIVAADRRNTNIAVSTGSGDLSLTAGQGSILLRRSGGVFNNLRFWSDSGDLAMRAGTRILAQGADGGGSWVRIGSSASSGKVALSAPDITIAGGSGGNSFAEVTAGAGGGITLAAARAITVETNALSGSQGRIAAVNGASLGLHAPRQTWNGPVRSGSGSSDGGPVGLSGAITAGFVPVFSLMPDASFAFAAATPDGTASSYGSALGLYVQTSDSGTVALDAPVRAGRVELISEESVALGARASLTGTGPGDAVVVAAGRGFVNAAGAGVLQASDPGARWLLYIDGFDGLIGAEPAHSGLDLYGRPFGATPPAVLAGFAGNRLVYGETPVLTLTAGSGTRVYGGAPASLGYRLDGLRPRDSAATALDGTPSVVSDGNRPAAPAGLYASTALATASDQGYALAFVPGRLRVDPAQLTITPHGSRSYGSDGGSFGLDYSGFVLGEDASTLTGTARFTTPATAFSNVGSYPLTASGLSSGNYAITYATGALTINPAALRVTANDATRPYGTTNPGFTARYDGFVLGQDAADLDGTLTLASNATLSSDAGRYAITASGLNSRNYAITYTDGALTIDPAALRVTANDATRPYGSANPGFTARYDGFVLGQDAADLDGTLTLASNATGSSDAGRYAITASGLSSRNYAITYTDGALTIDPAALRVTANDATRPYGSANPGFTARYDGFVLGQDATDLGGTLTLASDATGSSDAGRYAITASGLSSRNYAITYTDGALTIDPAALRVTANDATRTYGGANPSFTASFDGFVLGQDRSNLDGTLTFDTNATRSSDTGTYRVTPSGLGSGNYTITYGEGSLRIDPAALTLTPHGTRSYGSGGGDFGLDFDGFVLGEDASVLSGTPRFTSPATRTSDVGAYSLTVDGLTARNYTISAPDGILRITPATLRVTANDATRTYGSANPGFTARYDGFVLGQDASALDGTLTLASNANRASNTGRYAITASGLTSGNYAISYTDGALTIDPAALRVTANDATRTYGGANPGFTARYDGFVLGQDASNLDGTLTLASGATRASDTGRYAITASGLRSGNYAITYADGALTIAPAALRVTANDATRTYGSANPGFTARYDGFVLGQSPGALGGTLALASSASRSSDTGRYAIAASGLSSRNYAITYADGALTIDPAALRVTANDLTRTYGGANPRFTASYDGFVLGQSPGDLAGTLTLTSGATRSSDTGRYAITATGLSSRNYAITYGDGALSIDPAALRVTANDATRTYGAANPRFTASYDGFVLGQDAGVLDGSLAFATDAGKTAPVGRYRVGVGGVSSPNYRIGFVDGALTVAPGGGSPQPTSGTDIAALVRPFERGVPPYTPGDASFRTTKAEAPPAIDNPFALTYSLGRIVQLAPQNGPGGSGGFVPAAGGLAEQRTDSVDPTCSGAINRGGGAVCARDSVDESYWSSRE